MKEDNNIRGCGCGCLVVFVIILLPTIYSIKRVIISSIVMIIFIVLYKMLSRTKIDDKTEETDEENFDTKNYNEVDVDRYAAMCNAWIEHEEEMKSYEEYYKINEGEEP